MKKLVPFAALTLLIAGALALSAVDPSASTITGEVIDIAGYAMRDSRGEDGRGAGQFRASQGFPIGILTDNGAVYLAVYKNPAPASALSTANELLEPMMGRQIVARGQVFEAAGVNVIEIAIASEM